MLLSLRRTRPDCTGSRQFGRNLFFTANLLDTGPNWLSHLEKIVVLKKGSRYHTILMRKISASYFHVTKRITCLLITNFEDVALSITSML